MMTLFVFSPDVPEDFVVAFLYIATQRGTPKRWETIRIFWSKDSLATEKWIKGMIKDNSLDDPFDSIGWWKTQIVGN